MGHNYNNYNSNNASYEDGASNKEYIATYEYGAGANVTHEDGANYTKNLPSNYEQEMVNNNAVDAIPGTGAAEETVILDTIENDISASTTYTIVGI